MVGLYSLSEITGCLHYWVEPGRLLAGAYPITTRSTMLAQLQALLDLGIDAFIDLTTLNSLDYRYYANQLAPMLTPQGLTVLYYQFSIADYDVPMPGEMNTILDTIDSLLAEGHHIYLHCEGGLGRTGTVAGCYLVRRGLSGRQALDFVSESVSSAPSPETAQQRHFVLDWRNLDLTLAVTKEDNHERST
ncbi:MAG: protein-tyrosine phosphatase family protein [Anaerolineae bacterium]